MSAEDEAVLAEIRAQIAKLNADDRIRVEAIAMTFRNIVRNEHLAQYAYALVGAELGSA